MCDKGVSEDPFMLKHCHDRDKTQEICDKAADDFLLALKFVPDWFVTNKMIKKLDNALFTEDDILFYESDNVTFSSDGIVFPRIDLNNINLDDVNFDEDDPETIMTTHVRLMAWQNNLKQHKAFLKKRKQIINTCS